MLNKHFYTFENKKRKKNSLTIIKKVCFEIYVPVSKRVYNNFLLLKYCEIANLEPNSLHLDIYIYIIRVYIVCLLTLFHRVKKKKTAMKRKRQFKTFFLSKF